MATPRRERVSTGTSTLNPVPAGCPTPEGRSGTFNIGINLNSHLTPDFKATVGRPGWAPITRGRHRDPITVALVTNSHLARVIEKLLSDAAEKAKIHNTDSNATAMDKLFQTVMGQDPTEVPEFRFNEAQYPDVNPAAITEAVSGEPVSVKTTQPVRVDMWLSHLAHRIKREDASPISLSINFGNSDQAEIFAGKLEEAALEWRKEHIYKKTRVMSDDRLHFHIKAIAGRLLTIIDAMMGANEKQCEAMKTVIRKEFRAQFDRIFKETHMDDGACSSESAEDKATRELEI